MSVATSAVYVGEPAIATCLISEGPKTVAPLRPITSDCITAVLLEEPPVIVSPARKPPCTFETITTPCADVPPAPGFVQLTGVIPSALYKL